MTWEPLLLVALTFNIFCLSSGCRGDCSKFKCSSDPFLPRHVDPYLRPGATFTSPCSCQPDWSDIFCNLTQSLLTTPHAASIEHPTVCICRKFSDNNSRCEQFISRCFSRKNKACTCCFNQPIQYCNQLSCKNGEPDFGASNTTCVCHHNPTDYPYHICKSMYNTNSGTRFAPALVKESDKEKEITLLGFTVPITILLYVVLGILLIVSLLTIIVLIAGNRKLRRRREDTTRQRQAAHEALLQQRAEEDRYLPTV